MSIASTSILESTSLRYPKVNGPVDGRAVLGFVPNTSSISASLYEYKALPGIREVPLSEFHLTGKSYSVSETSRIAELAEKIRQSGEIAPLIVVVDKDGPYILEGAHRADALFLLGAKSFPALVVVDLENVKVASFNMTVTADVDDLTPEDWKDGEKLRDAWGPVLTEKRDKWHARFQGNPDITVVRTIPKQYEKKPIQVGDWVSEESVADDYQTSYAGKNWKEENHVVYLTAPASHFVDAETGCMVGDTLIYVGPPKIATSFNISIQKLASIPTEYIRQTPVYHSTSLTQAGEAILREGVIRVPESVGKGFLAPVKGRAYCSPSLETAAIYALGGVLMGHELDASIWQDAKRTTAKGRYGYIFEVDPSSLTEVQPDEDSVGKLVGAGLATGAVLGGYYPSSKGVAPYWLIEMAKKYVAPSRLSKAVSGEYAYFASIGKQLLPKMSDDQKLQLIEVYGAHIAHGGDMKVLRAWKLDKSRSKEIAENGSNVLAIAEEVPVGKSVAVGRVGMIATAAKTKSPEFKAWFGDSKVVDEDGDPLVVHHGTLGGEFNVFDSSSSGRNMGEFGSGGVGFFFVDDREVASTYADPQNHSTAMDNASAAMATLEKRRYHYEGAVERANNLLMKVIPDEEGFLYEIHTYDGFGVAYSYNSRLVFDTETEAREAGEAEVASEIAKAEKALDSYLSKEQSKIELAKEKAHVFDVYLKIVNPEVIDFDGTGSDLEYMAASIQRAEKSGHDGVIFTNIIDALSDSDSQANVYVVFNANQIKSATDNSGAFDGTKPDITASFHINIKTASEADIPHDSMWKRWDGATKGPALINVIKNPSNIEMSRIRREQAHWGDEIGVIITQENVYAFRRDLEFHFNIAKQLGLVEYIGVLLGSDGYAMVTDATTKPYLHTSKAAELIKMVLPQADDILYFDEDVVGDWECIEDEEKEESFDMEVKTAKVKCHDPTKSSPLKTYWKAHLQSDFAADPSLVSGNGVGVGGDLFLDFGKMVDKLGKDKFFIAPVTLSDSDVEPVGDGIVRSKIAKLSDGYFASVEWWMSHMPKTIKTAGDSSSVQTLWHVSNSRFKKFDPTITADGMIWFAKDGDHLVSDLHGASINNRLPVYLYKCEVKMGKVAGWDDYDKKMFEQLRNEGFDTIELDEDVAVLNANNIRIIGVDQVNKANVGVKSSTANTVVKTASSDAEYMAAVEAGNMETCQRMVDEAAKAAGYSIKAAHATNAPIFNEFRTGGLGAHFGTPQAASDRTNSLKDFSVSIGRNPGSFRTMNVYLSAHNMLRLPDMASLSQDGGAINITFEEYGRYEDEGRLTPEVRSWEADEDVELTLLERGIINIDQFEECRGDKGSLVSLLKEKGYDGIVYENFVESPGEDSYIIFDPHQVKSADPVMKDSSDKIVPLSQRFNAGSGDIRFDDTAPVIRKASFDVFVKTASTDAEYMAAVEAGDMEAAQRMVDDAAKTAGYNMEVLRGDQDAGNIFEYHRDKRNNYGIFTTQNNSIADTYARPGKARRFYLKAPKVLDLTDANENVNTSRWVHEWAKSFDDWVDRKTGENVDPSDAVTYGELYDYEGDCSMERWNDLQGSAEVDGYDALIVNDWHRHEGENISIAVFDSSNLKLADAVTKDGDGNVIPLSQRFDTGSDDIRFDDTAPVIRKASFDIGIKTTSSDEEYLRAVETGDLDTAQRLVSEAAKSAGYNIGPVWHGTGAKFTEFDKDKSWAGGFYFAKRKDFAELYAKGETPSLLSVYVSLTNPIEEKKFNEIGIEAGFSKSEAFDYVKSQGYDGIIGDSVVVAFSSSQIKSADPVVRDGDGQVIPLSNRFSSSSDIRFDSSAPVITTASFDIAVKTATTQRKPSGPNETFLPGERVWFEYHCNESHDSADAFLWYHSHQQVTVIGLVKDQEEMVANTELERGEAGMPLVYDIKFDDGVDGSAFEDELMYARSSFSRPNPPKHVQQETGSDAVKTAKVVVSQALDGSRNYWIAKDGTAHQVDIHLETIPEMAKLYGVKIQADLLEQFPNGFAEIPPRGTAAQDTFFFGFVFASRMARLHIDPLTVAVLAWGTPNASQTEKIMELIGRDVPGRGYRFLNLDSYNTFDVEDVIEFSTLLEGKPVASQRWKVASFDVDIKTDSSDEVAQAAKAAGYTVGPMYHGTNAKFNQFSMDYFGLTDDGFYGKGFYFSPDPATASEYGDNIIKAYLKITNPLRLPDAGSMGHKSIYDARDILADLYDRPELRTNRELPKGYTIREREGTSFGEPNGTTVYEVMPDPELYGTDREIYGDAALSPEEAIIVFHDQINKISMVTGWLSDTMKKFGRDKLTDIAKEKGYDALIIEDAEFNVGGISEIVVFNPSQIKSALQTYDDAGEIVPVEQRFNQEVPDMRFDKTSPVIRKASFDIDVKTPSSDDEYLEAIDSGDIEKVQRMVGEAAKAAGYNVGPVWHGTNKDFNEFRIDPPNSSSVAWFTTKRETAKLYSGPLANGRLISAYLKIHDPFHANTGRDWSSAPSVKDLKAKGYDGARWGDVRMVFDPSQIKSADPITRDDKGQVIPLSKRFLSSSDDIRMDETAMVIRKADSSIQTEETVDNKDEPKDFEVKIQNPETEYRGGHQAPMHDSGAPLHDLTKNGIYPSDVYERPDWYSHSSNQERVAMGIALSYQGSPNKRITVYRAVPKSAPRGINVGDWVAITRGYAKEHGEELGEFKIIQQTVYARDIFTEGDSMAEWGYDPQPRDLEADIARRERIKEKRKNMVYVQGKGWFQKDHPGGVPAPMTQEERDNDIKRKMFLKGWDWKDGQYIKRRAEKTAQSKTEVPKGTGVLPLPPGHIRLYHYTNADPETIRKEGLKLSMAKGHTYGEPNMLWASSTPMTDSKNVVEFSVLSDDHSMVLERPSKGQTPEDWMSGNHHVGFNRDIRPEEILAIHEPWHKVYRYIKNNHGIINDIVNGELDDLDENNYPDEFKAIREVKKELGHSTGSGAN